MAVADCENQGQEGFVRVVSLDDSCVDMCELV